MEHITRPPKFSSMARPEFIPSYWKLRQSIESDGQYYYWRSQIRSSIDTWNIIKLKNLIQDVIDNVVSTKLPSLTEACPETHLMVAADYLRKDLSLIFDTATSKVDSFWQCGLQSALIRHITSFHERYRYPLGLPRSVGVRDREAAITEKLQTFENNFSNGLGSAQPAAGGQAAARVSPYSLHPSPSSAGNTVTAGCLSHKRATSGDPAAPGPSRFKRQKQGPDQEAVGSKRPSLCPIEGCDSKHPFTKPGRPFLIEHLETHTTPYKCDGLGCRERFPRLFNLNRHRSDQHGLSSNLSTRDVIQEGSLDYRIRYHATKEELYQTIRGFGWNPVIPDA